MCCPDRLGGFRLLIGLTYFALGSMTIADSG